MRETAAGRVADDAVVYAVVSDLVTGLAEDERAGLDQRLPIGGAALDQRRDEIRLGPDPEVAQLRPPRVQPSLMSKLTSRRPALARSISTPELSARSITVPVLTGTEENVSRTFSMGRCDRGWCQRRSSA